MREDIDFVLTWVDGSDPKWQKDKDETLRSFEASYPHDQGSIGRARYRDWGILRYWFRAVEAYAPWVRKIHLVTCGQVPSFLNTQHEKIHLVSHEDIMKKEDLPTFFASAIELNMHRIEGLSERFVYFNDDVFLAKATKPEDFFKKGLPVDLGVFYPIQRNDDAFSHMIANALTVINRHFSFKDCLRAHPEKYLSIKYGRYLKSNVKALLWNEFQGIVNKHAEFSFLKSTFEEIWEKEPEFMARCSACRFRSPVATSQLLMSYWQIASGRFIPQRVGFSKYLIASETEKARKAFRKGSCKVVCLNDVSYIKDFEKSRDGLHRILEEAFPVKSSFEAD